MGTQKSSRQRQAEFNRSQAEKDEARQREQMERLSAHLLKPTPGNPKMRRPEDIEPVQVIFTGPPEPPPVHVVVLSEPRPNPWTSNPEESEIVEVAVSDAEEVEEVGRSPEDDVLDELNDVVESWTGRPDRLALLTKLRDIARVL